MCSQLRERGNTKQKEMEQQNRQQNTKKHKKIQEEMREREIKGKGRTEKKGGIT